MGQIVRHSPICLGTLAEYSKQKARTLDLRSRFYKELDSVNQVLRRYEEHHPELRKELTELEQRIHDVTRGVPGDGRDLRTLLDEELGTQHSQADRFLCKKYFKALASRLHPDRAGGDLEAFQAAQAAARNADLDYLRIAYACTIQESVLHWRCTEGLQLWRDLHEGIAVRRARLRATEAYEVLRLHIIRNYEQASQHMKVLLMRKVMARTNELQFIINRGLHHD